MKLFLLTISLAVLFSSCYSYRIFHREYRSFSHTGEKKEAFILNPELTKELQILKQSGIFKLVADTVNKPVVKIKLYPLQKNFVCGQPVVGSFITLGQIPVLLPDKYQFKFDEVHTTDTIQRNYELRIATRYWFWDLFAVKKNFSQKAGQTLLAEYYHPQLSGMVKK